MLSITPSSISSKSRKSASPKRDAAAPNSREILAVKTSFGAYPESPTSFTPQPPECPADTLKVVIGDKGRRSRCAPEFLHEVAVAKRSQYDLGRKFKIITGKEAIVFYKRFLK